MMRGAGGGQAGDRAARREAERLEVRLRAIDTTLMQTAQDQPGESAAGRDPGIGPIGALNLALRVDAAQFKSARHFAAWLGWCAGMLDRRQAASGRHQPGRR